MFIAAVAGSTFTSFLVYPADAGRKGLGTAGSLVEERGGSTTRPPCMGFWVSGLCPWEADGGRSGAECGSVCRIDAMRRGARGQASQGKAAKAGEG